MSMMNNEKPWKQEFPRLFHTFYRIKKRPKRYKIGS